LRSIHAVSRWDRDIGSDGLLTLSGLIRKKLDSPGFAERSTNMLFKRAEYSKENALLSRKLGRKVKSMNFSG